MKRSLLLCVVVLSLLGPERVTASLWDRADLYFETVGESEKSVSGAITALAQDAAGYLWIGTQHGIVRYDGYRFHSFSHDQDDPGSIGGDFVIAIYPAPDGRVWIGTRSSGASVFDPRSERFESYRHDPNDPASLADDRISAIAGTPDGAVWLGTNAGLDRFDVGSRSFVHHRHDAGRAGALNDDHVRALLVDRAGNLWVGTYQGLNRRRRETGDFESVLSDPSTAGSLADHVVFDLLEAADGALWVATARKGAVRVDLATGELIRMSPGAAEERRIAHPFVTAIAQPSPEMVWLGTNGGGIAIVDAATGRVERSLRSDPALPSGIAGDDIGALCVDASGLVWIGTWGAGLNRYNPANVAFRVLRADPDRDDALSAPHVLSVLELKDGNVWVGTQGNGIDVFDPNGLRVGGFRYDPRDPGALPEPAVHAMAQTGNGTVWVGTQQSGLHRYRPATRDFAHYGPPQGLINVQIRRLLAGPRNDLWIGTYGGLNHWSPETGTLESFDLGPDSAKPFEKTVLALAQEEDGRLWIGTDNGLFFLEPGARSVERVPGEPGEPGALSGDQVNGLLLDREGRLLVSTPQGIDRRVDGSERPWFESLNERLGIRHLDLGSNLVEDASSRIWTATHLVDPRAWTLRTWTVADGVDFGTPWDGSHRVFADGSFAIGGTEGLLLVRPAEFREWSYSPPLVISEVEANGKRQIGAGLAPVALSPETRSFSVEFAGLDYSLPTANRYAYRLEGYDPDWIETTADNRRATYTNLDPGHYTLRIKGSNRLGVWSAREVTLPVERLPAWFETAGFRLSLGLALLGLLYLAYRLRVRHLKASEARLQAVVAEQTRELSAKNAELEEALLAVLEASRSDPLTGLRNRRFLRETITGDTALVCRRYEQEPAPRESDLVFFVLDVDHFKAINDTYGHAVGDAFLVELVAVLRTCFRDSDVLVRWGGEEILAVSRLVDRSRAPDIAERARRAVEEHRFDLGSGVRLRKTCSIGFAAFPFVVEAPQRTTWEEVVGLADVALYAAKRSSRNAWIGVAARGPLSEEETERLVADPRRMAEHPQVEVVSSLAESTPLIWSS